VHINASSVALYGLYKANELKVQFQFDTVHFVCRFVQASNYTAPYCCRSVVHSHRQARNTNCCWTILLKRKFLPLPWRWEKNFVVTPA